MPCQWRGGRLNGACLGALQTCTPKWVRGRMASNHTIVVTVSLGAARRTALSAVPLVLAGPLCVHEKGHHCNTHPS